MNWNGILPAITTNFGPGLAVDHPALAAHCRWLVAEGCAGIVCCGSLGEAATLTFDEKVAIARTCVAAVGARVPVVLGVAALSTADAVALARAGAEAGCRGLMVLPPYVYSTDWREMRAHVAAVMAATPLSCMLYNNPVAYGTDFLPEQVAELAAAQGNLHAVKESSGDVRRITALRALLGDRLALLVGLDDAVVDGVAAGATGWVAGLVNAFPAETVALFNAARAGDRAATRAWYEWFLPLLRLDAVPKFVQYIKWVQAEVGRGNTAVRPPRLALTAKEVARVRDLLERARATRPARG